MDDKKSPHGAKADQSTAPHEPQSATPKGATPKNTTAAPTVRLYCCLPKGETYTDQPANKKAAELEARARSWIGANSTIWAKWVKEVEEAAQSGTRWSCQLLTEKARAHDLVDKHGEPFKVNNILRPALARILCEEVPAARSYVELRTSVFERAYIERTEKVA